MTPSLRGQDVASSVWPAPCSILRRTRQFAPRSLRGGWIAPGGVIAFRRERWHVRQLRWLWLIGVLAPLAASCGGGRCTGPLTAATSSPCAPVELPCARPI